MKSELQIGLPTPSREPSAPVEVIFNAHSGLNDDADVVALLTRIFEESHLTARIQIAKGDEVDYCARRAAATDCEIVVAAGGDGTISTVAGTLIGKNKTLGVLPLGTLNHFAKDLNIPLELEDAARIIIAGHVREVDVGEVNGHFFINNSSLGLYPSIVRERQKKQRLGYRKWPAFLWASLAVLKRYPFLAVRLSVDDQEIVSWTPFVFIGNNEYEMETFQVGSRDCLDAGLLSLYMTHRISRFGLLRLALRALFGGLREERDFTELCSREIWIETRRTVLNVAMDGEVIAMHPPLHYQVRPRALRVLAPKGKEVSSF